MKIRKEVWGGALVAVVAFAGAWSVGQTTDGKALQLIEGMMPSVRFLSSSVMTATATILALILTLISFTAQTEKQLRSDHYQRVRSTAKLACAGFIGATILLILTCLPIKEVSEKVYSLLNTLYYFLLVYAALLGGLLVTIVLQLYQAATNIILIADPTSEAENLLVKEDPDSD